MGVFVSRAVVATIERKIENFIWNDTAKKKSVHIQGNQKRLLPKSTIFILFCI